MQTHLTTLRIATRSSPLALWQAKSVARQMSHLYPQLNISLVQMQTQGDKLLESPLAKIGGKGLFVKELEAGILNGRADIAVHSMKDVPVNFPAGLTLGVVMAREDPRDAFVSHRYTRLDEMPEGALIGTSSLRRQAQIRAHYPQLTVHWLRGNVNTRLRKLDDGEFDAIILASAGLIRLDLENRIKSPIPPEICLPAIGQGVLGIEMRHDDNAVRQLLEPLSHAKTTTLIRAERALNRTLNGGCQVPIAGYAVFEGDDLYLRGLVGEPDGSLILRADIRGKAEQAENLGIQLAQDLINQGADQILSRIQNV